MTKYIYILPHKVKESLHETEHIEILTQKTTLVLNKGEVSSRLVKLLRINECLSFEAARELVEDEMSGTYFEKIVEFMEKHQLAYVMDRKIGTNVQNFINYLAQYTNRYKSYLDKMMSITFRVFSESERAEYISSILSEFGLNATPVHFNELERMGKNEVLLVAKNSADLFVIEKIAEIIEKKKENLWSFVLFYEDAFFLSPVLNQKNFTDFYSLKNQIDFEELANKNISHNRLVQNIGINEMVSELLTSVMKLKIQTTYDKAFVYESNKKSLSIEKIYYYPELSQRRTPELVIQRWDGEVG